MLERDMVTQELERLIDIRTELFGFLDESIPKRSNNIEYDFSKSPTVDAKRIYEYCFKLDYQARKLRGFLVKELDLKV